MRALGEAARRAYIIGWGCLVWPSFLLSRFSMPRGVEAKAKPRFYPCGQEMGEDREHMRATPSRADEVRTPGARGAPVDGHTYGAESISDTIESCPPGREQSPAEPTGDGADLRCDVTGEPGGVRAYRGRQSAPPIFIGTVSEPIFHILAPADRRWWPIERAKRIEEHYAGTDGMGLPRVITSSKDLNEVLQAAAGEGWHTVSGASGHCYIYVPTDCVQNVRDILYNKMPAFWPYTVEAQ